MPGPCCHLVTRSVVLVLIIATAVFLILSLSMQFYYADVFLEELGDDGNKTGTTQDATLGFLSFATVQTIDKTTYNLKQVTSTSKIGGAMGIVGICFAAVAGILTFCLCVIQAKWNKGEAFCVTRERPMAIAALVFSFLTIIFAVVSLAMVADQVGKYKKIYDSAEGETKNLTTALATYGKHGSSVGYVFNIIALVFSVVTLVCASIPQLIGIQYCGKAPEEESGADELDADDEESMKPSKKKGFAATMGSGSGNQRPGARGYSDGKAEEAVYEDEDSADGDDESAESDRRQSESAESGSDEESQHRAPARGRGPQRPTSGQRHR